MRNRIFQLLTLFFMNASLSGCIAFPFLPLIPVMGSAYEGYVVWKSGEATKYYAFDLDTTYRAVVQASVHMKLEETLLKSSPEEGYSLETKGTVPMHIEISPLEKGVTAVVIKISIFGDKHYVELFYSLVDDNLPRKAPVGQEKTS
jgi:hypothetical protein